MTKQQEEQQGSGKVKNLKSKRSATTTQKTSKAGSASFLTTQAPRRSIGLMGSVGSKLAGAGSSIINSMSTSTGEPGGGAT